MPKKKHTKGQKQKHEKARKKRKGTRRVEAYSFGEALHAKHWP